MNGYYTEMEGAKPDKRNNHYPALFKNLNNRIRAYTITFLFLGQRRLLCKKLVL
jgi:hypothetical protein